MDIGMKITILIVGFMLVTSNVEAVEYHCTPSRVVNSIGEWTKERIEKWKPSTIIKHYGRSSGEQSTLSRCSYSMIEGKRTCDTYPMDHYETTAISATLVFIDKFYYFPGQYDVQLFIEIGGEIRYIENNGRGAIYRGKCTQP